MYAHTYTHACISHAKQTIWQPCGTLPLPSALGNLCITLYASARNLQEVLRREIAQIKVYNDPNTFK